MRASLLEVGEDVERELTQWVPDEALRDAWRRHVHHGGPRPAHPVAERPLAFRGRSGSGSVLELREREDRDHDAIVDGAEVERIAPGRELDSTVPGLSFRLGETEFHEEFGAGRAARASLARFAADPSGEPPWRYAGELVADGLVDVHLGLTPRGRRALATVPPGEERAAVMVDVATQGGVEGAAVREAVEAIESLAAVAPRPLLHARLVLVREPDPARKRPSVAKASLDVSGRIVRAHVAAPAIQEAIAELRLRLRRSLTELAEREESRRRKSGVPAPGEWRRADLPTARPDYFPRPSEERLLVRRKTLAPSPTSPEEAALDMGLLDHDFYLFENAATGEDNVVHRLPGGALALAQPTPDPDVRYEIPLEVDPSPAPTMELRDAIERLDVTDEPFVFFLDAASGRGAALYRRYDGHYGLLAIA